ncbi:putative F420-dependent oxidoreductase [Halopolyspora algeriensis]|uniref:Putative F420-dependent oxidoreductase n=1 Tax=Halopolyspora algeriensis TaxID=1500506 RepID=A0A368VTB4_9ACTN|nr:LLM class F420-dependent oxidoreductase [Halopolyspora algeriensis]RCW45230.1 putative F420-dependent oxidoreductase [Halopolyspora algeriensis]TQM53051.1 putative F420-dependent oxidoreductase [Halopolyspora algeriensis]
MAVRLGKVGLWTGEWAWDPINGERREAVAELDDLGYGTLWLGNATGDLRVLSELLGAGKKLVVATGIVNVWTHDAAGLAAAYQRVDRAHPGRVLIGLGSSHAPLVERTGQAYTKPYSKLRSFLDELDRAESPLPPHAQVLAALGPRTLALAGQRTAGAHPYLVTPEHTARAREILGEEPLLAPEQKVVVESDPARAREIAREGVAVYLGLPNYVNNLRRLGFAEDDFTGGGSDRLIDALVAWGDVDTVLRRVREHHEAGADHVALQVLTGSDELPREQWRELAPAVREA